MKEFWKSVYICRSNDQQSSVLFLETVYMGETFHNYWGIVTHNTFVWDEVQNKVSMLSYLQRQTGLYLKHGYVNLLQAEVPL